MGFGPHLLAVFSIILAFFEAHVDAQISCAEAPTPALKIVCEQLHKWDTNARKAPPVTALPKLPPAIPGQPAPLIGAELAAIPTTPYQCMDLGCLCGYMGGNGQTGSNSCTLSNGRPLVKSRRKEYRLLTDDERQRFHAAVLAIKRNGEYDNIARIHSQFAESGGAHSGPAFLPWHREFTKRYEIALRMVDPTVTLPYWDSTLDGVLPTPTDSIMFSEAFMGMHDQAGNVVTGPFANWRTLTGRPNIQRRLGAQGLLFQERDIQYVMSQNDITKVLAFTAPQQGCQVPIDWNVLEYTHGNVHIWVGGDMIDQSTSANDPIFFLHHSFVDHIWELYRQNRQDRFSREIDYPLDQQQCSSPFHFGSAYMAPFQPWRNVDGLNNKYTDNMFEYDPRPQCPACGGSPYLFCDMSHGQPRCAAKIRVGGNCNGFFSGENACYNGQCQGGRCVGGPAPTTAAPPPVITTRTPPVRQDCFNEHECCSVWATKGECQRNPTYMNQWCKASCQRCSPNYPLAECNDRHPKCSEWSRSGECQRNPLWMAENCRQSCGKCTRTRQQICGGGGGTTQPTTPRPEHCNPVGRVTCGYCIPRDYEYGTCFNYHRDCANWAARGECQKNPWMLENCKESCQTCFSWFELRQFCRGGGTRRGGRGRGRRSEMGLDDFSIDNIGQLSQGMPAIDLSD